jgi:large subunit ribosomal protein L17
MRHKKSFNHLSRTTGHRRAMMSNMASSLIKHKRIETTTAKAKALKRYIEPLITRGKDDTTHSRRVVFSYLQDKEAVTELFREVASKVGDRPGGYTRIIKLGHRVGDSADMCLIELVDFNENLLSEKAASKKSAGRRRRGSGKKKTEDHAAPADVSAEAEEPAAEQVAADESAVEEESAVAEEPAEEIKADESAVADVSAEAEASEEEKSEDEEPDEEDTKKYA